MLAARFAQQLSSWYEGVVGYYACYPCSPLPSSASLSWLQSNFEKFEISGMPKPMFLKSFKCPAQGKYIELTPPPGHLSLTHPPHKDPKRAQNPLPHAYELVPRRGLSQKKPSLRVNFLTTFSSVKHAVVRA